MKVHSYGAGIQSIALLWKYLNGEFEKPDLVIFADTQSEPNGIYEAVGRDKDECERQGIEFVIVTYKNLAFSKPGIFIPAYTLNKNGHKGTLLRQCTDRFKIQPIRRELRRRGVKQAEIWLGISTDEAMRMRDSRVRWCKNRYPLIELNLSRRDCEIFLGNIGIVASKSACIFCPYRNEENWMNLTSNERKMAIEYDERLRNRKKDIKMYVHPSRIPLKEVFERYDRRKKTGFYEENLFDNECEGYCGL